MRIAVLVLGIIGSLTALAYSCGAAACAGVLGGMGEAYEQGGNDVVKEIIQGVSEVVEESEKRTEDEKGEMQQDLEELNTDVNGTDSTISEQARARAKSALLALASGILGLVGSIMTFITLGNGNKAIFGASLITAAVILSILYDNGFPNILFLIAGVLAFLAKPEIQAEREV